MPRVAADRILMHCRLRAIFLLVFVVIFAALHRSDVSSSRAFACQLRCPMRGGAGQFDERENQALQSERYSSYARETLRQASELFVARFAPGDCRLSGMR